MNRSESLMGSRPSLVIDGGAACSALRRTLGATAWFVLEELALRAAADVDRKLIAQVSTRDIAAALGLNKDTVTRSLARLRDQNVIEVVSRGGLAGATRFAVRTPDLTRLTTIVPDRPIRTTAEAPSRTRVRRRRGETGDSQLSLLQ